MPQRKVEQVFILKIVGEFGLKPQKPLVFLTPEPAGDAVQKSDGQLP
jgi:hypothetical protein